MSFLAMGKSSERFSIRVTKTFRLALITFRMFSFPRRVIKVMYILAN